MPFVVALFLVYLVRPLANTISSCRCRRRAPPEEGEAATGPERASLLHASTDPKLMLRDMETRLPRWAGVFLALLFAISVMVAFALAITLTLTSFEQSDPRLPRVGAARVDAAAQLAEGEAQPRAPRAAGAALAPLLLPRRLHPLVVDGNRLRR